MLVLNRNYLLITTSGHAIKFKKGEPTHVPPTLYRAALSIGAVPADGSDPDVQDERKPDAAPVDPAERNENIMAAILKMIERNEREDFTAAGMPSVDAVTRNVGYKVSSKEIASVWQKYHEDKAKGEDK